MPPSRGRWKPTDDQVKQIETLAGIGLNQTDMAHFLGVSEPTFERGIKRYPALRDAVLKGRSKGNAKVGETAYKMATSGKDTAMTIFWLKCKLGFKDVSRVEHTGADGRELNNAAPKVVVMLPSKDK